MNSNCSTLIKSCTSYSRRILSRFTTIEKIVLWTVVFFLKLIPFTSDCNVALYRCFVSASTYNDTSLHKNLRSTDRLEFFRIFWIASNR